MDWWWHLINLTNQFFDSHPSASKTSSKEFRIAVLPLPGRVTTLNHLSIQQRQAEESLEGAERNL
jgi:hypothetical protein